MNIEQLEAVQKETDEDRIYRMQFIEKKSKADVDFVEKELVKFQKRGIPVYIFSYLSTADDDGKEFKTLFQYNNLGCFRKEDSEGHATPETLLLYHRVNKSLAYHVVRLLGHMNNMPEEFDDCVKKAQEAARRIYSCFMWCIMKDPHEEGLRNAIKEKNDKDQNDHL